LVCLLCTLFRSSSADPPGLLSFPTRRSSDLIAGRVRHGAVVSLSPLHPRAHVAVRVAAAAHHRPALSRVSGVLDGDRALGGDPGDRKSTRLNSSHRTISYAVFCLKKKKENVS